MRTKEELLKLTAEYWHKQGRSREHTVATLWANRHPETTMTDISKACDAVYGAGTEARA